MELEFEWSWFCLSETASLLYRVQEIKSTEPTGLKLRVGGCNGTKRFPFWLAPRTRVLWKLIIASAYNDPLRWFEASSSGCSAGANWQSLSRPAMNYEPIIHGCRAEFTRVYRLRAEPFPLHTSAESKWEKPRVLKVLTEVLCETSDEFSFF